MIMNVNKDKLKNVLLDTKRNGKMFRHNQSEMRTNEY